jgi:curved DNA-binding protein CbpA
MNRRSDRPKDYYSILGVSPTAELVVIRAAYRALALRYHPDTWGGDRTQAENLMRELNEAYEVLSNATSRKIYDEQQEKTGFKDSRDRGHAEAGFGRREDPSFGLNPIGRKIRLVFKWLAVSTFSIIAVFAVLIASMLAYDAYKRAEYDRNAAAISFQITADKRWCSDDNFPIYIYVKNSSPKALEQITLTLDASRRTDRSLNIAGYHLYSDDHIIDKGESMTFCSGRWRRG